MRVKLLLVFVAVFYAGCYTHGPFKITDPSTEQYLTEALDGDKEILFAHSAWFHSGIDLSQPVGWQLPEGTPGVAVLTADALYFQNWNDNTGYRVVSRRRICDIEATYIGDTLGTRGTVTVITDRPDSFIIATPAGTAVKAKALELYRLLESGLQGCAAK